MKFWSNSDSPPPGSSAPEKRLLAAVLQRAITDYVSGDGEVQEGARAWLFDNEPTDAPLSFRFVCEALDLDPESLRSAVRHQKENQTGFFGEEAAA
jgi:hypothetical protein